MILLDNADLVRYLNSAAEDLLQISVRQAEGRTLAELIAPDPELLRVVRLVREAQQPYALRDVEFMTDDPASEPRTVDCYVAHLDLSGDGQVLLQLTDTTRSKRISRENALLRQHGVTRKLLRELAHEIRNPLSGVRGAAQLLARRMEDEALVQYTRVIITETDRLTALLDTMLGPGAPLQLQQHNIHELLQHVLQLVAAEAPAGIALRTDYDPSLPPVRLDRNLMLQAFLNLARNALQAVSGAGQVIVRSRALSSFTIGGSLHRLVASIEFEDSGDGVPEGLRETLFYPLVTGRADGTGLGLPLAQELVHRHGGLIEYESRPGRTVFRVLLPIDMVQT